MQTRKWLATVLIFCALFLGVAVKGAQADSFAPQTLERLLEEIRDAMDNSDCNEDEIENSFNNLREKYYGNEKFGADEYYMDKNINLPPAYNSKESYDMIQSHHVKKFPRFPSYFPEEMPPPGQSGVGLNKALHYHRYLMRLGANKYESNVHTIFWLTKKSGRLIMNVLFWDSRNDRFSSNSFDFSHCGDGMEDMKSWVEQESARFLSIPGSQATKEFQLRKILEDYLPERDAANVAIYLLALAGTGLLLAAIGVLAGSIGLSAAALASIVAIFSLNPSDVPIQASNEPFNAQDYDVYNLPQTNPADLEDIATGNNYGNLPVSQTASGQSSSKKPELYVTSIRLRNGKTKYYDDETIHVDGYAKNSGKSIGGSIKKIAFKLYRFKGEKENGDAKEVGSENIKGENFGAGKTKHEEFSFGAPSTENKYQLFAIIDANNTVKESNESNNRLGNVAFRVHKRPDIKVSDLTLTDGRIRFELGEIPNARATFTNSGGEPFEDVPVRWYLDGNHFADDNMRHWNIEHGDEKHEDVNILQALSPGNHTIKVCADFPKDKDKSDNCRNLTFEVYSDDQVVSAVQLTDTVIPVPTNSMYGASITIQNNGLINLADGIQCFFEIKGPSTNDQWTQIGEESIDVSELIPGATKTQETTTLIPTPDTPGEYELRGCIDAQHVITETDESNNCKTFSFTVNPASVPLMSIKITDPEKGEKWRTDKNHSINWGTTNIPKGKNVKIEYSLDGGSKWLVLTSSTPNNGNKKWDMEDSPFNKTITKDTDKAMIRITLVEYPEIKFTSGKFTIDHKK